MSAASSCGYCSRISDVSMPPASRSRMRETQMRWPRMQGFPKQRCGSIQIRERSCSWGMDRIIAERRTWTESGGGGFGGAGSGDDGGAFSVEADGDTFGDALLLHGDA